MTRTLRTLLAAAAVFGAAYSLTACSSAASPSVVGTWGEADVQGQPSLVFSEDGSFSGSDGCNRLFGSYTTTGDTVDLGAIGSTMMYCEGVDTWLVQAARATIDGDTLVLSDENEQEIGTLARASE